LRIGEISGEKTESTASGLARSWCRPEFLYHRDLYVSTLFGLQTTVDQALPVEVLAACRSNQTCQLEELRRWRAMKLQIFGDVFL